MWHTKMSHIQELEGRAKTGIEGLDYLLAGGLPQNHLYLIEGTPGTGKTTLALQFLREGVNLGETCLYVTLSESKGELLAVARSHGWSLDGVALFELGSLEDRLRSEEQYTVFHPAEVELGETTKQICMEVERIQPARIVFDSLSEMRLLARDPLRYRRQILALKQFFCGRKCTVILLDDRTSDHNDLQLQSISHGVILLERLSVDYGGARRRLTVIKMRGLRYIDGHHDFYIQPGGLVVFPRLVAALHKNSAESQNGHAVHVASSGIPELDSLLGGGIPCGTSALITGPAGSGKSTLLTHYAAALAGQGKFVTYFLFEETRENFLQRAEGFSLPLAPLLESGHLKLLQIDPSEMSPGQFAHEVRASVERGHTQVLMIDSLNGYLNSMPSENYLLLQMHELLTYLNQMGILTLMSLVQHGLFGRMEAPVDLTYLADCVIVLRYFEAFGSVHQALAVIKKRTGNHERTIRQFEFTSRGVEIGEPLTYFDGVLTGTPVYRGPAESLMARQ
jgi:circadian clock protein KaiC